ncbi:MAG: cell division protein FtsA, partial [Prevotella sp.]|nr:cell division protein FtsA [Prevotella sp.]
EVNNDLFSSQKKEIPHPTNDQRQARQISEIPAGVIRTEAEKQKAEEEKRRQEEEAERLRLEEEEKERQRIKQEKRENSFWNKFMKKAKEIGKDIVSEE